MRRSQPLLRLGPCSAALDLAYGLADAVFVGLQRIADRGLTDEADDRGGDILVLGLLPGGAQRRSVIALPVQFEAQFAQLRLASGRAGAARRLRARRSC